MKKTLTVLQIIVGVTFILSGFVKSVDPVGFAYKFTDYFNAFGLETLKPYAFTFAVVLSGLEFILGVALVLSIQIRIMSFIVLIFMGFFTLLTYIIAKTNAVSDCGCFGDAIKLSNWETYWKNVVLIVLAFFIYSARKETIPFFKSTVIQLSILFVTTIFISCIIYYSYNHLPLIDFRPYKVGTSIPQAITVPEDASVDEYETILIYSKDGVQKEFTINDFPANDDTWTFVDSKSKLVKKGYEPPIKDFTISDIEMGQEITDVVLSYKNYNFILITYDIGQYQIEAQEKINGILDYTKQQNIPFIALTASPLKKITQFKKQHKQVYDFYLSDETTLKTIIRSNPGLLLLKSGVIIDKWHYNDIPSNEELKKKYGL